MAQQAIRLKYGMSVNFSPGGGITGVNSTAFLAKVQNIAFEKDVAVRYAQPDGTWVERALGWQKTFGTYDLFALSDNIFVTREFVLRYSAAGQTTWDNNNGANYRVSDLRPNTVGGQVVLRIATARRGSQAGGGFVFTTSWVEGEILVNNLSFNKRVGVRLSPDNWASFADTLASFSGTVPVAAGVSGVEVWKFKTPELNLDASAPEFKLAVFYDDLDTGQSFWDNNFGQDYTLSKVDASTLD